MASKEEVSVRFNFANSGDSKLTKNQTKLISAVIKHKLGCDIIPCLNHGKCTLDPFGNLGFLCICPPGFYGDFCQHRAVEPFTVILLLGIIAIPILILALCFAICCICNRERLHHQALIKSSDSCLNPLPVTCASKPLHSPYPQTDRYQEKYENIDCEHPVECENMDFLLCNTTNDSCQYYPELNVIQYSGTDCPQTNVADVERCTGNYAPYPEIQMGIAAEEKRRKCSSHSISQDPCPAATHVSFEENQQTKASERNRINSSSLVTSKSPCLGADRNSFVENEQAKVAEESGRISSSNIVSQDPCPAAGSSSIVKNKQTEAAEGEGKTSTSSTKSQGPCPAAARGSIVKSEQTEAAEQEIKKCTSRPRSQSPCPESQLIEETEKERHKSSSNAPCLNPCSAYEFNCLEGSMTYIFEDSEGTTCSTESCERMIMEKCDAECQFSYPASRESSEDCNHNSIASCLDKVVQTSSIFQCKSQEMLPCNNLSDITSSSQSSYQEYLSTLSIDVSTPRSESSSQTSSSSDIANEFGNKSPCSLNSLKSREALLNLMQSYFANGDDVKSVKISILMDKSQTDVLSNCTNVKESTSRISHQKSSPSTSQEYSQKALKNKCYFLDHKSIFTDLETSLTSVENSERNSSGLDSPEIDSLIPTMMIDSSDWYCAEDNEPCSKTTTVRYMFTDSETDA